MSAWSVNQLLDAARTQTGLDDFGAESFREGLEVLVHALNHEARLNDAGQAIAAAHLTQLLATRLQIEDCYRQHPEIDQQKTVAPIFILGLPRTGTTALSYLLAEDPETRSLRTWESQAPVPPPEAATEHDDPRISSAQSVLDAMHAAYPDLKAMHDSSATSPTECQDLLGREFRAQHFCGQYWVPSFARWQIDCDMVPAYRYHKRTLKLLQWRRPPRRWNLKTPTHMLSLDALVEVYPDARFIMTHRDPVKVLPSVCSLIALMYRIMGSEFEPVALGRAQMDLWAEALRRAIEFRRRVGSERFIDLRFEDLNANPLGAVARIYGRFGMPLTDAARQRMTRWVAHNPRGKHGEHHYRLKDFGLNAKEIRDTYAFYMRRFDVPNEGE